MVISIRRMVTNDVPFFNRVRNDSREFLHDDTEYSVAQSSEWFTSTNPEYYILTIDGADVGYFRTSHRLKYSIHIGLDIAIAYRGRGYAKHAYNFFMNHLHTTSGINRFYLCVLDTNPRGKHIYETVGFKSIRCVYNTVRKCKEYHMMCEFSSSGNIVNDDIHYIIEQSWSELQAYDNSTILVTGVGGFIGRWLYNIFAALISDYNFNIQVVCVDIDVHRPDWFNASQRRMYYMACNISRGDDIDNLFFILSKFNTEIPFGYIFNCAGIANPQLYMRAPIDTLDGSYIGTKNLIEKISNYFPDVSVMLFSSSEIYGNPSDENIPTPETYVGSIRTDGNRSCYDVGKLALETLGNIYSKNTHVKIFRPFNLYGPLMHDSRIVPSICNCILRNIPIKIYGHGVQTRTFCYIADAICMILKLSVRNVASGTYNIGICSEEIDIISLAKLCIDVAKTATPIELIEYPPNYPYDEPMRRCPDITKAVNATGYQPIVSLRNGITKTLKYYDSII